MNIKTLMGMSSYFLSTLPFFATIKPSYTMCAGGFAVISVLSLRPDAALC